MTVRGRSAWGAAIVAAGLLLIGGVPAHASDPGRTGAPADAAAALQPAPAPAQVIDAPRHGEEAVEAVGLKVRAVAAANGMTASALTSKLAEDDTMWLDKTGRLTAIDTELARGEDPQGVAAASAPTVSAAAPFSYDQTFRLHSRPGSHRTIYLDFNGHVVSGTAWNNSFTGGASFTAEPYDTDGNAAAFSTGEQDVVQRTWQRVSEDYAPLDVDVTTEEPAAASITRTNAADLDYGTRLVVTNTATIFNSCGCGGIAYVGVFDLAGGSHDFYQPGFVFERGVGGGDKNIAEAASHEVGHNLGLSHDGTATAGYYTGQGSWAPIMGVGYYKAITQWSKGEYAGASNTQDDLAVMQAHGAAVVADDAGDTNATAKALTAANLTAGVSGLVSTRTDVDVYAIPAGTGTTTININPAPLSPNLDVRAELYNAAGVLVASSDPASGATSSDTATGMNATITAATTNGTYYLKIDGVGAGSAATTGYSDYASLGRYTITGTVSAGPANVAPTAKAAASATSVETGKAITFSAAGSVDSDGTIAAYAWTFGDGQASATTSPSHAYAAAGTYPVSLTVTDNAGATAKASLTIVVTAPPSTSVVRVGGANVQVVFQGILAKGSARVVITDLAGKPVVGAAVTGNWSGAFTSSSSASTAVDGSVVFATPLTSAKPATFTFTVTAVSKTGVTYDPTKNVVSSASVIRR